MAPFYFLNAFGLPFLRSLLRSKKQRSNPIKSTLSGSSLDEEGLTGTPQVSTVSNNADNNAETAQRNHGMVVEPLAIVREDNEEGP